MNLPRSTFYYHPVSSEVGPTDAEVMALIENIQDEFPRYGYRRVTHELRRRGLLVNHKKVDRIMRLGGFWIRPRRRFVRTTDSRHDRPIYPNLYQNHIQDRPSQVWVADFTYIRVARGFCYLAIILDACSRKVVGYTRSQRLDTPLALAALHSAVTWQKTTAGMHSSYGQGLPIRIPALSQCSGRCWLRGSMSSVGNPYHKAQPESFMKTLKVEEVYIAGYATFANVTQRLPVFIERVYNTRRLQSALGHRPPEELETLIARQAA